MSLPSHEVTALLRRWKSGDAAALDALAPLISDALHRLAHQYMKRERAGHVLQTTALVNEVYARLLGNVEIDWANRAHFFAVTAQVMRRTLVEYARQQGAAKRGGDWRQVTLDDQAAMLETRANEIVALDEALQALRGQYPRAGEVVELRYFGGYNNQEIATMLKIGEATVERDWRFARAFLSRELSRESPPP